MACKCTVASAPSSCEFNPPPPWLWNSLYIHPIIVFTTKNTSARIDAWSSEVVFTRKVFFLNQLVWLLVTHWYPFPLRRYLAAPETLVCGMHWCQLCRMPTWPWPTSDAATQSRPSPRPSASWWPAHQRYSTKQCSSHNQPSMTLSEVC